MKRKKRIALVVSLFSVLALIACTNSEDDSTSNKEASHSSIDHSNMNHSGSGEVPEGLQEAAKPKYPVGSKAVITDGHMEEMQGVEATIVGAYDTIAYSISYTPTNGGERVTNHKWIIQEEIQDAGDEPLQKETEVIVNANHMEGMDGAEATIDFAERTTVYMVDYTMVNGEKVTNHQWVTESELSPAK